MRDQRGIISMITTIMVSILLITLAIGLVSLLSGTLQQSSDDELSVRATVAAEGGVEWAITQLLANPSFQHTACDNTAPTPIPLSVYKFGGLSTSNIDNVITCILVHSQTNQVSGSLDANASRQIMVPAVAAGPTLKTITVSWISSSEPGPNLAIAPGTELPCSDPANPSCLNAAGIELTLVRFPIVGGGTVTPANIKLRNALLLPSTGGGATIGAKVVVDCVPSGGYQCSASIPASDVTLALLNNEAEVISIRSRYLNGSNQRVDYSIGFTNSSGGPFQIQDQFATIDVTARAGSVYRRIIAQAPIGNNGVPGNLNYVLFGDQSICKSFDFYKSGGVYLFNGICPPS